MGTTSYSLTILIMVLHAYFWARFASSAPISHVLCSHHFDIGDSYYRDRSSPLHHPSSSQQSHMQPALETDSTYSTDDHDALMDNEDPSSFAGPSNSSSTSLIPPPFNGSSNGINKEESYASRPPFITSSSSSGQ